MCYKTQRDLDVLTAAEAEEYLAQGQFAPGSMMPKILAGVRFVKSRPDGTVLITSLDRALDAIEGKTGTRIIA